MDKSEKLNRLQEMVNFGETILKTSETRYKSTSISFSSFGRKSKENIKPYQSINQELAKKWQINSLNILEIIFGKSSTHFIEFSEKTTRLNYTNVKIANAVLKAAKDDFEKGYYLKQDNVEKHISDLKNSCDEEAKRNAKIYLMFIFVILIIIFFNLFYFQGFKVTSIITFVFLIICYFLSAITLKEWTPTKLPERIIELEKERLYKRFGIEIES